MSLLRRRMPLNIALTAVALSVAFAPGMQYLAHAEDAAPVAQPEAPATPAAQPEAPAVPAGPQIDPRARELINQMLAAYKGLKTYTATMDLSTIAPAGQTAVPPQRTTIVLQRPNRASLKTTVVNNSITIVSNGTNLFAMTTRDKTRYLKRQLPTGAQAPGIADFLRMSGADGPGIVPLIMGVDPLAPFSRFTKSVSVSPDDNIDGVSVDVVTAELEAGPSKGAVTFMIGKEDHLLRKATVTQSIGDKTMIVTESHSGIKINSTLAANAFAFIPPAGAKPVVSLEPPPADPRLKVGVVPFAFNAKDIKGQPVNLGLYKGRVLLLDFWAMWCKPCVEDLPTVVNVYNKFNKRGFSILGISLDPEGQRNNLIKFAQTHRMPWRHIYDGKFWDSAVARKYGVQAIPFNLLIGRDGKIAAVNVHGPDLVVAVSKALAKK